MWYYFAHSVLSQYNTFDSGTLGSGTKFAQPGKCLSICGIYITLFKNLAIYVFMPHKIAAICHALSLKSEAKDYLFHFWFLGCGSSFVLIPLGTHLAMTIIKENGSVAVFVGTAFLGFMRERRWVLTGHIVLIFISSIYYMANAYNQMYPVLDAGKTVEKTTEMKMT